MEESRICCQKDSTVLAFDSKIESCPFKAEGFRFERTSLESSELLSQQCYQLNFIIIHSAGCFADELRLTIDRSIIATIVMVSLVAVIIESARRIRQRIQPSSASVCEVHFAYACPLQSIRTHSENGIDRRAIEMTLCSRPHAIHLPDDPAVRIERRSINGPCVGCKIACALN